MLTGRALDVFPVVEAHVPCDQRPLADLRAEPGDRVSRTDRDAGHVLVEPGAHLVTHDAHALRMARLDREAIDELVELRMLDEQAKPRLRVAGAVQDLPWLRRHERRG